MNPLYFGDCLAIIRDKMRLASVDLVYLDPPFNSQSAYNSIYKDETGRLLPDQVRAFNDAWTLDQDKERIIRQMPVLMRESGIEDSVTEFWRLWMNALRETQPELLAYLAYMTERLIWIKRIIKPAGSIYLHCDPTASHYIKVMMDSIFHHSNFRNEITWYYKNRWPAKAKKWQSQHDVILFYTKTDKHTFKVLTVPGDRVKKDIERGWGTDTIERNRERGSRIRVYNKGKVESAISSGRLSPELERVDQTKKTGDRPCPDVWEIDPLNPRSKERLGYATQKPLKLMHGIIEASSKKGDVVFDPFCGCGSTLEAAHRPGRQWIGTDIAIHAIKRVSAIRLKDRLGLKEGRDFEIDGVPENVEGARHLWEQDKYTFHTWAVETVDGFVTDKKTADGGVDGRLYFELEEEGELQSMIIEVKAEGLWGRPLCSDFVESLRVGAP